VIAAGQAGLATSYWLSRHGIEHQLLERRPELAGAWQDHWICSASALQTFRSCSVDGSPPVRRRTMLSDDQIRRILDSINPNWVLR
jgi:cation diffusion facilitator CzcD-associated flavoprotein CzcO